MRYLVKFISRKVKEAIDQEIDRIPDSLSAWPAQNLRFAEVEVHSEGVIEKSALHLHHFQTFFAQAYGYERSSTCLRRDIVAWQQQLHTHGIAPSTINNHLASFSTLTAWAHVQDPRLFPISDQRMGIGEIGLPPLEPRASNTDQVRSLKSICDRFECFHRVKGYRHKSKRENEISLPIQTHEHPWQGRAMIYMLLSTELHHEELVLLDHDPVEPCTPEALWSAQQLQIAWIKGKSKSKIKRTVFLSANICKALADYPVRKRPQDSGPNITVVFLSAASIVVRTPNGRLSSRAVNLILLQIGRWHDSEIRDPARWLSLLQPHALRQTYAFQLAKVTGANAHELERSLGHRSVRYIQRYTNPLEQVAASYIEEF